MFIINMNDLLEWNISQKTKAAEKALHYLEERAKDLESIKQDREKLIKKAGKKAKQKEEELGPLDEGPYLYLNEEILEELLVERVKHPECNAGVIFDNLQAKEYPNELIAVKIIVKALKHHTVQLVLLEPLKDEAGFDVDKIIEWENMEKTFVEKAPVIAKKKQARGSISTDKQSSTFKKKSKNEQKTEENKENLEIVAAPEPELFEVYEPREHASVEEKQAWQAMRQEIIDLMMLQLKETMKDHLEIPKREWILLISSL